MEFLKNDGYKMTITTFYNTVLQFLADVIEKNLQEKDDIDKILCISDDILKYIKVKYAILKYLQKLNLSFKRCVCFHNHFKDNY